MAANEKTKALQHQGEYVFGLAHDSDHKGIVRIFVGLSSQTLIIYMTLDGTIFIIPGV